VDGLTGGEVSSFIKRLASGLAVGWDKNYNNVLGWVRARLGFALVSEGYCAVLAWFAFQLEKYRF